MRSWNGSIKNKKKYEWSEHWTDRSGGVSPYWFFLHLLLDCILQKPFINFLFCLLVSLHFIAYHLLRHLKFMWRRRRKRRRWIGGKKNLIGVFTSPSFDGTTQISSQDKLPHFLLISLMLSRLRRSQPFCINLALKQGHLQGAAVYALNRPEFDVPLIVCTLCLDIDKNSVFIWPRNSVIAVALCLKRRHQHRYYCWVVHPRLLQTAILFLRCLSISSIQ